MIFQLNDNDILFPDPSLAEPDGLLAIGGDLSTKRLIAAYQNGIFPWFSDDDPICWFAPHERCVIFSTNMHPDDLMDPAFQRRIGYKLETVEPPEDLFIKVFVSMAKKSGLALTQEIYKLIIDGIRTNGAPLAYFQPKFIVEQVLASCKFEEIKPQFTFDNVNDALANLFIKKSDGKMFGVKRS